MDDASPPGLLQIAGPRWARWLWILPVLLLVAVGAWYAVSPAPLPEAGGVVTTSTPAGQPVYVGVMTLPQDAGRTLHPRSVAISGTGGAEVQPMICLDGAIGVTADPARFCSEVVGLEDNEIGPGDQLIVRVAASSPGIVSAGPSIVSYRDGLQWDTQETGPRIEVEVLP